MGIFDQAFAHLAAVTRELGQPKGEVRVDCEPRTVAPGGTIRGHASFTSPDRVRQVKTFLAHFQIATTRIQQGTDHTGKPTWGPVTESRDLVTPVAIAAGGTVAPGEVLQGSFELTAPAGLPAALPGQIDYYVVARADVADQVIDPWAQVPILVGGAVASGGLAPGTRCVARSVSGLDAPAMIVEVRGAVTFVQWTDGSAATWVPTATVRPL